MKVTVHCPPSSAAAAPSSSALKLRCNPAERKVWVERGESASRKIIFSSTFDSVLDACIAAKVDFAVMPCCHKDLLTSNLPWDYTVTSYEGGKLIIVSKEKEELLRTDWLNNPSVMADSHNGLWSSCLSVSGRKDGEGRQ